MLGVLRSWRAVAGELREEQRPGLGAGSVRDRAGNQWLTVGSVIDYSIAGDEIESLAERTRNGIHTSQNLRNALWLHGRANRTTSDYYMIHEYAELEFGGTRGVRDALGISVKAQERLTASANNLSPLEGGRHAGGRGVAPMALEGQRAFTLDLLKRWIDTYA